MKMVTLNLSQKQTFYRELQQFVRNGIPLPQAVEALAPESSGAVRRVLKELLALLLGGRSVPDAFAALPRVFGALETSMITAASGTGRLEQAFGYLAGYFQALAALRSGIVRRTLWPVILLHVGIVVANTIPLALGTMTRHEYLVRCGVTLAAFYALGIVVGGGTLLALRIARGSAALDATLGMLPLVGKLRRHFALSRFCATYEMQLQAGVNVLESVRAAGEATQSARIKAAVARILPKMRAGVSLGSQIGGERAFPAALQRSIRLGEENGSLDEDLLRWAAYYQESAVSRMETVVAWVSRAVYLTVAGYLIYATYAGQQAELRAIDNLLKQ